MCCTLPFGALLASLPSSSPDGRPRSDCKPYRLAYVIPLPIFCGSAGSLDLMGVRDERLSPDGACINTVRTNGMPVSPLNSKSISCVKQMPNFVASLAALMTASSEA